MPISIRSRLLLLVMSVLLPAIAGALWVIADAFKAERAALERGLRDTAGALSMVVDRELTQRVAIARTLSMSIALDKAPALQPEDLSAFAVPTSTPSAVESMKDTPERSTSTRRPPCSSTSESFSRSRSAV